MSLFIYLKRERRRADEALMSSSFPHYLPFLPAYLASSLVLACYLTFDSSPIAAGHQAAACPNAAQGPSCYNCNQPGS